MSKPVIMFDHDGVLIDSLTTFSAAFVAACAACGQVEIDSQAKVVSLFESNVYESMVALGVSLEQVETIVTTAAASLTLATDLRPFCGVNGLLAGLAEEHELVVITSNSTSLVRSLLDRHGLGGYVRTVVGGDVDTSKVRKITAEIVGHPDQRRFIYVGDTGGDMVESAVAGAEPVGAGWGWHGRQALTRAGATFVADTPTELLLYLWAQKL
ncbi:MAG: HAD family hydrolase [Thermoleophilia bacterium]